MRRTGYIPELIVDYEKNDVFADSHESDSFQIGSVGRENVDLLCGNVTLTLNDFVWAGNRMPVTLRHMYNSVYAEYDYTANSEADIEEADYSLMKLGKGWKLNIMQSVIESVFQLDGTTYDGYMFLDEYGKKTYLVERTEDRCEGNCENGEYTYEDYYQSGILYEADMSQASVRNRCIQIRFIGQADIKNGFLRKYDEYNIYAWENHIGDGRSRQGI